MVKKGRVIIFKGGVIIFIVAVLHAVSVGKVFPSDVTEGLKGTISKVIEIVSNKDLKQPDKKEERQRLLREVIKERFDFEEMSNRSLATHWKERTSEEKREFIEIFSNLLENSYVDKIESYTDEEVVYTGESVEGDYAVVKTNIIKKVGEGIPIDYKLIKTTKNGNKWMVYDFTIEGVSMVNNYRSQFNKIIRSSSYEELVKKMKTKREDISLE
ncbi:MAG: ABC transporter substrate-binding protein [Nitrospinae bacterium]|nr:ABC transporter substrate-binding protein [Nitrospinota bacterium]